MLCAVLLNDCHDASHMRIRCTAHGVGAGLRLGIRLGTAAYAQTKLTLLMLSRACSCALQAVPFRHLQVLGPSHLSLMIYGTELTVVQGQQIPQSQHILMYMVTSLFPQLLLKHAALQQRVHLRAAPLWLLVWYGCARCSCNVPQHVPHLSEFCLSKEVGK